MKYDYIVIGGGIIGMTTAREIANRGASVAILDRQSFGNEASRVAGGILSPIVVRKQRSDAKMCGRTSLNNIKILDIA